MTYKLYEPWLPMTSSLDLKVIGKLGEEVNELGSAVARCIIQGVDEKEPVTGKVNRQWLQEEIADVLANIALVSEHFGLDEQFIDERIKMKTPKIRWWHAQTENK